MTEADLTARVYQRFSDQGRVVLPQVPDGTGGNKSRTLDALVIETWPSRGLEMQGIEIKVSRGDLLKEIRDGSKADSIGQYCHRFWLVVPEAKVAKDVLPAGWGLLVARGEGLRAAKQAPLNEHRVEPDLSFVAAVLRRARRHWNDESGLLERLKASRDEGFHEGQKVAKRRRRAAREGAERDLPRIRERLRAFEEASGIRIDQWAHGERLGEAVRLVKNDKFGAWLKQVDAAIVRLAKAGVEVRAAVRAAQRETS